MFVRVGADTSGLQRGMRQAEGSVRQFGRATQNVNLDRLRGPLASVAAQLTGLNPAFGTLSSTLLSMAAGGAVTAAAIGGFALVGAAIRSMTADSREAREETEKLIDKLNEAGRTRIAQSFKGQQEAIEKTRAELNAALEQRGKAQRTQAEFQTAGPFGLGLSFGLGNFFANRGAAKAEAEVQRLSRALYEQERAFAAAWREAQKLDGMQFSVATSAERAASAMERFGERVQNWTRQAGTFAWNPNMVGRLGVPTQGALPPGDLGVRPNAALVLRQMSRGGIGGGALDNAVGKFEDAVDAFGQGVKDVVTGAFSTDGLANIGANLASQGIGFLAGKVFEGIGSLFGGTERALTKLAQAMEQNTRALRASSDFLAKRLSGAGLSDEAEKIGEVLRGVLDRAAISPDGRINLSEFREAMKQAGISMETFAAVAKLLGINIETLSVETLEQFWESIDRATAGLGGFSDQINEALRNFPTLFNPNLARFRAGGLTAPTSGSGNRIETLTSAAVQINGPITVVASDPETFVNKLRQKARRGGPSAVQMAY